MRAASRSARRGIERKRGIIPGVTRAGPTPAAGVEPERGFVVAVLAKGADAEDELGELRELARTAGVEPVGELVQQRPRPDPRTYVGKGKLEELKQAYGDAARRGRCSSTTSSSPTSSARSRTRSTRASSTARS